MKFLIALCLSLACLAQEHSAVLTGTIVDELGGPVIAAKLTLRGDHSQLYLTRSSERGTFRFARMEPGTYTLMIDQNGFCPLTISEITVRGGAETALPRTLLRVAPDGQDCPR